MNTAQEPKLNNEDELLEHLAEEIAKLSKLLTCALPDSSPDTQTDALPNHDPASVQRHSTSSVLLGKLVEGLDLKQWERLAAEHNFQSWLALPLEAEVSESVAAVRSMLDQLIYQRDHDALTGLANRRYFDNYLVAELERAKRNQTPLSLVMLDLDKFKQINDTYGHPCGDQALRELGHFLAADSRSFELVARIGGDEFAIVLPASDGRNTYKMLERLRRDFNEHPANCEFSGALGLTFSAGIGVAIPDRGCPSVQELIEQADKALYDAKRNGRNQICIAPENYLGQAECMVLSHEKKFLFSH
ncbi:MAG: GGDEF domain-containing protein [Deltaproteobacteria bacterium]|jgi:diguanylate cyclase (GGDEF)-like protein|nr:GGDEF domain-containing protein [Deltaproteobacteria bacterium]